MNKNQNGFSLAKLFIIVLALVVVGGLVMFVLSKNKSRVTIKVDNQSFSIDTGRPAGIEKRASDGKTREYYASTTSDGLLPIRASIYKPTASSADLKTTCKYEQFQATILGNSHTVCNQKDIAYIANFKVQDVWYQIAVFPEDGKTKLPKNDTLELIESIKLE